LSLHTVVVNDDISLDEGFSLWLLHNWWAIEVDLVVDYQQRVVGVEHIVVDGHTIQILL